ncbi:hypothetical protein [Epibacterium ulvae]|uniref:hypothetical protein n=1 Tax=Epibacterium ulvae TaxID=1156985 RepID=UPI002492AF33|nr:hypothetical protein [Epibacterium ulvae]
MRYSSWDEIEPTATPAERELKACAEAGEPCKLGPDDKIPSQPKDWDTIDPDCYIRADVLRFLILSDTTTEKGVMLGGAYISGTLDLMDCEIAHKIVFVGCQFQQTIDLTRARCTSNLRIKNCALLALHAAGSSLSQQLDCGGTKFLAQEGKALNLQGAKVSGHLILRDTTVQGAVHLHSSEIGGSLDCTHANFLFREGYAFSLQGAEIKEGFLFRSVEHGQGVMNLTNAYANTLLDDQRSWPSNNKLILDGFTYDKIIGETDAKSRLAWLEKGDRWNGKFFPQPYKQLAKVLHDMGHEADALKVRVALARKLRAEQRRKLIDASNSDASLSPKALWKDFRPVLLYLKHTFENFVLRYGYERYRVIILLPLLVAFASYQAQLSWTEGSMVPNSSVILASESWLEIAQNHPDQTVKMWMTTTTGSDWESFNAIAYGIDLVIPLIEFGQTDTWAPSTNRGRSGARFWWLRWVLAGLGFVISTFALTALTNVFQKE